MDSLGLPQLDSVLVFGIVLGFPSGFHGLCWFLRAPLARLICAFRALLGRIRGISGLFCSIHVDSRDIFGALLGLLQFLWGPLGVYEVLAGRFHIQARNPWLVVLRFLCPVRVCFPT